MSGSSAGRWEWPPRTILVAVDFGEASGRALALGGVMASEFGATVRTVHAERFEPPPYFTMEQIVRLEAERRAAQAVAVEHLASFAASSAAGVVEPVVVDEPPVDAILEAAAGTDLVVMGTHGRRGPGRWWLGSVAERVVRASSVPVLVTRAAALPPRDVFRRVTLVRDVNDSGARSCAESLARIGGAGVIEAGTVSACETDVVERASLVVIGRGGEKPSWLFTDSTAKVLSACASPVLFVPAP